jgi:hypothetical protein
MDMQELEITIDKNGRVQVAVKGVKGDSCMALTKELENAIGHVEEREYSAEYYEQAVEANAYRQIGVR